VAEVREVPGGGLRAFEIDEPSRSGSDSDSEDSDDDEDEERVDGFLVFSVTFPFVLRKSVSESSSDDDDELEELEEDESDGTCRLRFRTRFLGAALLAWSLSIVYSAA
jgi:hypothetical protein